MTEQNDNYETPPAVETSEYEGPSRQGQRSWNRGTTTAIVVLAVVFLAIIIYFVTR